jgi:hypothetical protein
VPLFHASNLNSASPSDRLDSFSEKCFDIHLHLAGLLITLHKHAIHVHSLRSPATRPKSPITNAIKILYDGRIKPAGWLALVSTLRVAPCSSFAQLARTMSESGPDSPVKSDIKGKEINAVTETVYEAEESDSLDPVYQAKAKILNNAIQEIGMGSYQVFRALYYLKEFFPLTYLDAC